MLHLPPLILTTVISFIISNTEAQIVGCETTKCSKLNEQDSCPIGNSTLSSIGTIGFNTTLSALPLTWTVGFQEILLPNTSEGPCNFKPSRSRIRNLKEDTSLIRNRACWDPEKAFHQYRNYYIGTPARTTDGNSLVGQLGCALFFEGVSGDLRFPGKSASSDSGTCEDALSRNCVADFMQQVRSKGKELVASGQTRCTDLQAALQNDAPESCTAATDRKWGTIFARGRTFPRIWLKSSVTDFTP